MLIIMTCSQLLVLSLCCLPMAASLRCYTCVFPVISQMDCLKFPQECPAGQRCLASTAVGTRGSLTLKLYEKSCAISSHCGLSGQKEAAGFNFNYSNVCCDTDLCNGAVHVAAPCWKDVVLLLLPVFYVITLLK